jgi:hypothetical protein
MFFFFIWNYMFARFFAILGVDSKTDSYNGLFIAGRYFLNVYENSIGNINSPSFSIWSGKDQTLWIKVAV